MQLWSRALHLWGFVKRLALGCLAPGDEVHLCLLQRSALFPYVGHWFYVTATDRTSLQSAQYEARVQGTQDITGLDVTSLVLSGTHHQKIPILEFLLLVCT